jgi:segregation and condensation protein B
MSEDNTSDLSGESSLSLSRLRQAFAAMLGEPDAAENAPVTGRNSGSAAGHAECESRSVNDADQRAARRPDSAACEISPRSVVEAILFVGRPDNSAMSARELAAAMRGVSPSEIDLAVRELNAIYEKDQSPYSIEQTNGGYRLTLRDGFLRMRDKLYGRVREAKLSATAIEVLSIVAYNQPVTAQEINELRGAASGGTLSTLVRRRLVRLDRSEEGPPRYGTTDRFLALFGLENLAALPRSEELGTA